MGGSGQHQSARRQDATGRQDRPLLRLITRVAFTSLSPAPPPSPPSSSLRLLMTNRTWQAGAINASCDAGEERRALLADGDLSGRQAARTGTPGPNPLEKGGRSESERASRRAIELIEINIHDWTRGQPGHLAARLVPTSVTVCGGPPALHGRVGAGGGRCCGVAGVTWLSPSGVAVMLAAATATAHRDGCCVAELRGLRPVFPGPDRGAAPSRLRPLPAPPAGRR